MYYGTATTGFAAGEVVEVLINNVSCGTATADSGGEWTLQIGAAAPCGPTTGATVTFTRNGLAVKATETWASGDQPNNILGIDGTLASVAPAAYNGTFTKGDVIEAFIGTLSCAKTTASDDGSWALEVGVPDVCKPKTGSLVTFTLNGEAMKASATWAAGSKTTLTSELANKPSIFVGTVAAGDVIVASIGGVTCGSTTALSDGSWSLEIASTAQARGACLCLVHTQRDRAEGDRDLAGGSVDDDRRRPRHSHAQEAPA